MKMKSKKGPGETRMEEGSMKRNLGKTEEEMEDLVKLDLKDDVQGFEEGENKRKREKFEKGEATCTSTRTSCSKKRKRRSKGGDVYVGLSTTKQQETMKKKKERKVKVTSMPVLVLEKVFSYLDWKDLGRVMLVCRKWSEVGGHPSLWTGFRLKMPASRTIQDRLSKIRRLDWVKSVEVTTTFWLKKELVSCEDIVQHFTRMEEIFVLTNKSEVYYEESFKKWLWATNNRIVRIGYKWIAGEDYQYFVTSADAGTNTFIRKTFLPKSKKPSISIVGPPGIKLSDEILNTNIDAASRLPLEILRSF